MFIRPFTSRPSDETHRVATPLELFFDLVSVVAIAATTAAYHHQISYGHGLDFLLPFLFAIVSIWWVWANFTTFACMFDNDDSVYRFLVFLMMGGFAIYAGGVDYIFESFDATIGVYGWIIMRVALIFLWLRAASQNPRYRKIALFYAVGLAALQVFWFIAYVVLDLGQTGFLIVGAILMLGEFAVPYLASRRDHPPLNRHHMVERHGLLNIIVLGEIILASSLYFSELHDGGLNAAFLIGGAITVAITCMMWSYYFMEDEHLAATETLDNFMRWSYFHVLIYVSGAMVGAAGAAHLDVLTDHSKVDMGFLALITNGALALYILTLWIIRDSHSSNVIAKRAPLVAVGVFVVAGIFTAPYWMTAVVMFIALSVRMYARSQHLGSTIQTH